jgi:hypothetical protein
MRRLSFAALTCSAMLLVATGCGVRHTPVSGVVTVDGQPHGDLVICFVPVEGGGLTATGMADDDGKFQLGTEKPGNGVKPGKYKVTVNPGPAKDAVAAGHPSDAFNKKAPAAGGKVDATKEFAKLQKESPKIRKPPMAAYADPAKSPLEIVEVTTEPKEVKLELKSDAK